uniref:hypothetical protein n=1 Tax=Flavobacterium sp. TaxID=239 RepID=UPI00404B79E4
MNKLEENNINKRIDEKIENGYELDLGQIIDNSFEIFKKIIWTAGFGYLLVGLVTTLLVLVGISFLDPAQLDYIKEITEKISKDPTFLEKNPEILNYYMAFIIVITAFFTPINAGFLNLCHLAKTNQKFTILNIFDFYKLKYATNLILGTLFISAVSLLFTTLLEMVNLKLVAFVIQISLSLFTVLFIPLIIYGNQNISNAIIKSAKLVVKYPFTILGAIIIAVIFAFLGFIALCIGILFTFSYINCIYYSLYNSIIGFENKEMENSN